MEQAQYILCPGQGAQVVGMGQALFSQCAAANNLFEQAKSILGWDLAEVCFNGPAERLNQTDVSQPALYVCGVASFIAATESGKIKPREVSAYAGLSLGEYTALHLAGVFDFAAGLRLVEARGRYMQQAAVASAGSMVALLGADETAAQEICNQAAQGQVLVAANFNAPGQIVLSGHAEACARAQVAAEAKGFKAAALKVAGAFHSPLMQAAAEKMTRELAGAAFASPSKPVYSNVTAKPHGAPDTIKQLLVAQIVQPVMWSQTMQRLVEGGEARFVELSPGRTLAGLAKRINRRLAVETAE